MARSPGVSPHEAPAHCIYNMESEIGVTGSEVPFAIIGLGILWLVVCSWGASRAFALAV